MKAIATFTLVPIDGGISLSSYVAACQKIIMESNLIYEFHANGTNIEGDFDEVLNIIKACQLKVHDMGVQRIHSVVQVGTRLDRPHSMRDKKKSVEAKRTI